MLDYHLHLWPHGERHADVELERLAAYCDEAQAQGVTEIAITEHLFRFAQADAALGRWWEGEEAAPERLRSQAASYWAEHTGADLDVYVDRVLAARAAGLPVVLGLEVDHYRGRMDEVQTLLDGYPFDVLLGSVHWIGAWLFDVLESAEAQEEWDSRPIESVWDEYTTAVEELAASGAIDVLAHPDLCKVSGRRPTVPDEFHDRIAEAAAACGLAAEVSSAGWRKPCEEEYPAPDLLRRFKARGVPVTTASDAHGRGLVAHRSADLRPLVEAAGYTELAGYRERRRHAVPL
ncbi:MAG TPA: PHP domain-containing protein [Acidimicrobiales bacterium]